MEIALLFLPLLASIISGFFGKYLGDRNSEIITSVFVSISAIISLLIFYNVIVNDYENNVVVATWINSGSLDVNWSIKVDALSSVMLVVVTLVSALVHIYSIGYMSHDPHKPRFMAYLSLFTFSMLTLVTSDNFLQLFFGWEGVGLCSYFLIGFWFKKDSANAAAIKAFVVNRVGDFGFALGIFLIFYLFGTVNYNEVFNQIPEVIDKKLLFLGMNIDAVDLICILLFIGAMGKSAQIFLHTWLPDAMEGPTPVSALIHAATMVTAGVFLLARCSSIYEYSPLVLNFITILGASTAFFAATVGLVQNDLKRVIAYSTCSQLGYMVFACGLSNYSVGVFHLMNHAFFKALLFLGAGSVIHAVSDEQDMRKMGGLKNLVPFTYSLMVIGSLALIGFPFLTGFYSKDVILEVAYGKYSTSGHYSYLLGSLGAFLTAFYSTRLLHLTFLSNPNGYKSVICSAYDSSYSILFSLCTLSIPSIFIGYLTKDMIIGMGTDFWGNSIFVLPEHMNLIDAEFIEHKFKILPVILSLSGATSSFILYSYFNNTLFSIKVSYLGKKFYNFFSKKWFFDKVYNEYITQSLFKFSYSTSYKLIDRGIIEILGPMGLSSLITKQAKIFYKLQTGSIYHYSFTILLALTILIGVRQFWLLFGLFLDYKVFVIIFITLCVFNSNENLEI